MDIEDENALFDTERVKRELALEYARQYQFAVEAYTKQGNQPKDTNHSDIALIALQEAVAELMVKHNRILWRAFQQYID